MHAPVARRPPPEHAFIHPGVGSGVGSWGGSWGEIAGATGNAIRVGGYLLCGGPGPERLPSIGNVYKRFRSTSSGGAAGD